MLGRPTRSDDRWPVHEPPRRRQQRELSYKERESQLSAAGEKCTKATCRGSSVRMEGIWIWSSVIIKSPSHSFTEKLQHRQRLKGSWRDHSLPENRSAKCRVFWLSRCDLTTKDTLSRGWTSRPPLLTANAFWQAPLCSGNRARQLLDSTSYHAHVHPGAARLIPDSTAFI